MAVCEQPQTSGGAPRSCGLTYHRVALAGDAPSMTCTLTGELVRGACVVVYAGDDVLERAVRTVRSLELPMGGSSSDGGGAQAYRTVSFTVPGRVAVVKLEDEEVGGIAVPLACA